MSRPLIIEQRFQVDGGGGGDGLLWRCRLPFNWPLFAVIVSINFIITATNNEWRELWM